MSSAKSPQAPSHHGRLTTMDASFLYFERESAPMHIGALAIIDGEIDYERYLEQVENRLRRLPRFRERIVPPPFYVGHPTWETDPGFDLRRHMPLHQLESPGSMAQVRQLTNRLIEGQLDRTRPLWEIHVIQGVEGGRTALVSKVHHAMVDGGGGNAIMLTLYDLEPEPPVKEYEDRYQPSSGSGRMRRVGEAMWDNVRTQIDVWSTHLNRMTDIGQGMDVSNVRRTVSTISDSMPELMLPPKRLPFNKPCTGERDFTWTELSFTDARAIRRAMGGTLNDVVLTGLAGALAKYARHHGIDTEGRTARVMCPVNVRPESETGNLGNLVSILPVRVPLDLEDPAVRLQSIRSDTRTLKEGRIAEGVSLLTNLASAVPAPFQAVFGAIAVSPYPLFNLVCTNVPGPQIPLYAQGHRLLENYPIVPVGFDMGVCCAVFSYAQKLHFGLNSDVGACDDIDVLRGFLDEAFDELIQLSESAGAGAPAVEIRPVPIRGRTKNSSAEKADGKAAAKKSAPKKSSAKKKTPKKAATRKATAKKTATKKTAKKTVKKKAAKKKLAKKKVARKKAAGKKAAGKKAAPSKRVSKASKATKKATKKTTRRPQRKTPVRKSSG